MKRIITIFLVGLLLFSTECQSSPQSKAEGKNMVKGNKQTEVAREPVVAGAFYPGDPVQLSRMIAEFFKRAKKEDVPGKVVGLISPHAGYIYSGQVAAYAYKLLEGLNFEVVVIIAPSHTLPFSGSSVFNGAFYQTPLGKIEVDKSLAKKITEKNSDVFLSENGHTLGGSREEHSLEVQLPFLQIVLGNFKLIPIIMGDQDWESCQALASSLAEALRDKNALIVASSDLSHFHPYEQAVELDNTIIEDVSAFDPERLFDDLSVGKCEACGGGPMIVTMLVSKALGADKAKVLNYANSGDVTGDHSGVVGYMSAVFYDSGNKSRGKKVEQKKVGIDIGLSEKEKKVLKDIAEKTIDCKVREKPLPEFKVDSEILKEKRGAFVTIEKHGNLRGCIGYIEAIKPLFITIQEMAEAAALKDPRFPPVTVDELKDLEIEISVLTPLKRIKKIDEIEVGKHGLYMKRGYYSGLLLPQVATDYGWDKETFLKQTCHKAGMGFDCWKDDQTEIYVFSADIF